MALAERRQELLHEINDDLRWLPDVILKHAQIVGVGDPHELVSPERGEDDLRATELRAKQIHKLSRLTLGVAGLKPVEQRANTLKVIGGHEVRPTRGGGRRKPAGKRVA